MKFYLFLIGFAISGCANLMQQPPTMNSEQLNAIAKDKNATVLCTQLVGAGGTGTIITVNLDKGTIVSGSVMVEPNCKVTMTSTTVPK